MLWLIHYLVLQIGLIGTGPFVDLFLWEQTGSLRPILLHNLGVFITLPLATFLLAWLYEYLGGKVAYFLSIFFALGYALVLIVTYDIISFQPFLLGLLRGVALGAVTTTVEAITLKLTREDEIESFSGKLRSIEVGAELVLPLLLAFSVAYLNSFLLLFATAFVAYIVAGFFILFLDIPNADGNFNLRIAFSPDRQSNPEKPLLAQVNILDGVKEGFFFSILTVIILQFAGSLPAWGIFSFVMALVTALLDLAYTRLFQKRQSLVATGASALIFTLFSVIFITNFNLFGLIIFAAGRTILSSIFGISLSTNIARISSLETTPGDNIPEYLTFTQFYKNIGRFFPIAVLLFMRASLDEPGILEAIIVAISLVPFSIIGSVSKSFALRHSTDQPELI